MKRTHLLHSAVSLIALAAALGAASGQTILRVDGSVTGGLGDGTSWANAFPFLQDALAAAAILPPPVEVWIAQGTYLVDRSAANPTGTGDQTLSFEIPSGASVRGGFQGVEATIDQRDPATVTADAVILTGDLAENDLLPDTGFAENSLHVVHASNNAEPILIERLTISGGNDGADNTAVGSAVFVENAGGMFIDLRVRGNIGNSSVYQKEFTTTPPFQWQDCLFTDSTGTFIRAGANTGVGNSYVNCQFITNPGAGIFFINELRGDVSTIDRCTFLGGGQGVRAQNSAVIISSCLFTNISDRGIYLVDAYGSISDSIFSHCGLAGIHIQGLMNNDRNVIMLNNTFYQNGFSDPTNGAAVSVEHVTTIGTNINNFKPHIGATSSVFSGNVRIVHFANNNGTIATPFDNHNFFEGDPFFQDADGPDNIPGTLDDNFRLTPASPSAIIDHASCFFFLGGCFPLPSTDFYGQPRNVDGDGDGVANADLGAAEFTPVPAITDTFWSTTNTGGFFDDGSFWVGGAAPGLTDRAIFDLPVPVNSFQNVVFRFPTQTHGLRVDSADKLFFLLSDVDYLLTPVAPDVDSSILIGDSALSSDVEIRNSAGFTANSFGLRGTTMTLGRGPSSSGALRIVGAKAVLDLSDTGVIGDMGIGTLEVKGGASAMTTGDLTLGVNSGASGSLLLGNVLAPGLSSVTQQGLSDAAKSAFIVGEGGTGSLMITGDSTLVQSSFISDVMLGQNAGSLGVATISGPMAQWVADPLRLTIGQSGDAEVHILDGAHWFTSSVFPPAVAQNAGSTALIEVSGPGSVWMNATPANIGGAGTATVTVSNGGVIQGVIGIENRSTLRGDGAIIGDVFNFGVVRPAFAPGASATLTVSGAYTQIGIAPGQTDASSGRLELGVSGTNAGQFDQLAVTGPAELAGGLVVSFANGFTPMDPNLLTGLQLVSASTFTGQFDVSLLPGLTGATALVVRTMGAAGMGQTIELEVLPLTNMIGFDPPTDSTVAGAPTDAATGDFDGDGTLDLVLTLPDVPSPGLGSVLVLLGDPAIPGSFLSGAQLPVGANPSAVASGLINADAFSDLAIANAGDNSVTVLFGDSTGTFTGAGAPMTITNVGTAPSDVAMCDLNNDGFMDLAVVNENPTGTGSVQLFMGDGAGNVSMGQNIGVGVRPKSVCPADVDRDGRFDLIVANFGNGTMSMLHNDPSGVFDPQVMIPVGAGPIDVAEADFDGDTLPDLLIADSGSGEVSVLLNTSAAPGSPSFAPAVQLPIGSQPRAVEVVDWDMDGDLDAALIVGSPPVVRILRNDSSLGSGSSVSFTVAGDEATNVEPRVLAVGDIDNDGDDDLITIGPPLPPPVMAPTPDSTARSEMLGNQPRSTPWTTMSQPGTAQLGPTTQFVSVRPNTIANSACSADLNGDGGVDGADLATLLTNWGSTSNPPADLNADGTVNGADLATLLTNWGTCP